jgi:peptide/nickel transport system substrate-binding protein
VRIEGDYVIAIELDEIDATFMHLMALPIVAPLCKSAGKTYVREWTSHPCGAGPFKLEKYENGNVIRLVRHDGYWQKGKPYLDAIEWSRRATLHAALQIRARNPDYMREFS